MRYLLSPKHTLLVRGPASFRLLSGNATILGAPLEPNRRPAVREEKQLPIEALSETDLEIQLGESGGILEVAGSTIPESWRATVDALEEVEEGKVIVVGSTDVGKSTLCAYLTNELLRRGLSLSIVDADIGQADIGPPTTIAKARPTTFISSLIELDAEALIFIGNTSPSKVEMKLIDGIQRLLNQGQQSLTVINTDGWVIDPEAILYKTGLISAIGPDLVVGISTGTELDPILAASRARSMRVETPDTVLPRSRTDRRQLRVAGYRRFLNGGSYRTLSLDNLRVRMPIGFPPIQQCQSRDLENLIVGLLDDRGYLLNIGIIQKLERNSLKIYSRLTEGVCEVEVGYVKLSRDGIELGYLGE